MASHADYSAPQMDAWQTRSARMQQRAFGAARRHSRLVRLLRVALPLIAALSVIALAVANLPSFLLLNVPLNITGLAVKDGALTMENPRLTGFGHNSRSYELSAKQASQDISNPKIVKLEDINARIGEADGKATTVSAITGVFDTGSEILYLSNQVRIDSASGYRLELEDAQVDLNKGQVITERPVQLLLLDGNLTADSMTVENKGDVIRFDGRVRLTFVPRQKENADGK